METKRRKRGVQYATLDLGGIRYAVLPEAALCRLCANAGIGAERATGTAETTLREPPDEGALAARLIERRRASGLSQAELARRAGVRVETLNRIERGRTTPDYSTIRKLVEALNGAESTPKGARSVARGAKGS